MRLKRRSMFRMVSVALIIAFLFSLSWSTLLSEAQDQDPFVGKSVIDPAWGLTKVDDWDACESWNRHWLDGWLVHWKYNDAPPFQCIRGERWSRIDKIDDRHQTSVSVKFWVYRFDTADQAQQYLRDIFEGNVIADLQAKNRAGASETLARLDEETQKPSIRQAQCCPWTIMTCMGHKSWHKESISDSFSDIFPKKGFAYVTKSYAYKFSWDFVVTGKDYTTHKRTRTCSRGDRVTLDEQRGIYIPSQEYVLVISVYCDRVTHPIDAVFYDDRCSSRLDMREVPFREDIWQGVSGAEPVKPDIVSISIIPPEITLPQGSAFQFIIEGKTKEGKILKGPDEIKPTKWRVTRKDGPTLKIDQDGIFKVTEFPGRYEIWAEYGDLKTEAARVSTVSRDTEPCCPKGVKGCEEIMADPLAARSYPKGDLDEVKRLYRETIPVGLYWKRVFDVYMKGEMPTIVPLGLYPTLMQMLSEVEIDITPDHPYYTERYREKWEEFSKRLKNYIWHTSYPGRYNNIVICGAKGPIKMWGGNDYSCGGYQGQVLEFLNSIKFNKNPKISSLLNGYDYGPIEAPFRVVHQGVVIYPRGTVWKETGIVLDPWPTQVPQIYTVDQFRGWFSWSQPSYIGQGKNATYPTHGHAYMYEPNFWHGLG